MLDYLPHLTDQGPPKVYTRGQIAAHPPLTLLSLTPATPTKTKRTWRRITQKEQLCLHIAVSFGLPVDFAGKVLSMNQRNANRIMQNYRSSQDLEMY
jgi:hypothetical protein